MGSAGCLSFASPRAVAGDARLEERGEGQQQRMAMVYGGLWL